eukprot:gene62880-85999_t
MNHSFSVWLVLIAALVAANLPFINERWLAVIPRSLPKTLWMRLAEMVLLYFVVGALGLALEQSAGQIAPQGWEFYATTGALMNEDSHLRETPLSRTELLRGHFLHVVRDTVRMPDGAQATREYVLHPGA